MCYTYLFFVEVWYFYNVLEMEKEIYYYFFPSVFHEHALCLRSHFSILVCSFQINVFKTLCCFREFDVSQASLNFSLSVLSLGTNAETNENVPDNDSKFEAALGSCLLLLDTIASSRYVYFSWT